MVEKEKEENLTGEAVRIMIDAMKKLRAKEITPQEAQGIAMLGKGVIDAANAEISFIKTVKALPVHGVFSNNIQFIEPEVSKESLNAQNKRLKMELGHDKGRFLDN